jgi:hypothetical protein
VLIPSIGSISGVLHLTAQPRRRPYVIAVIVLLLALAAAEAVPSVRLVPRWATIHQTTKR